jgi:SAM-dependent methyltransferase
VDGRDAWHARARRGDRRRAHGHGARRSGLRDRRDRRDAGHAARRAFAARAVCDAERLPFRRASFDLVASRIAPHHFPDLALFAQECARVLRPGGRLYAFDLTTPADALAAATIDRLERLRDPSHAHSWSEAEWRHALAKAGLRVARLEHAASMFDLDAWIARARMPAAREAELRRTLAARPELGGYGLTEEGRMRVLRVEILAEA